MDCVLCVLKFCCARHLACFAVLLNRGLSLSHLPIDMDVVIGSICMSCGQSLDSVMWFAVKWVPKYRGNGCQSAGKREKVPQSVLGSRICTGQRTWLQPGGCALMGCRCPISDGQGWAKAQPGHARNRTKKETRWGQDYLILWLRSPIYYRGLYIVIDKQ